MALPETQPQIIPPAPREHSTLRALIIAEHVESLLLYTFHRCGYETDTAVYEEVHSKINHTPYDLFCVEIGPTEEQGFDLIPYIQAQAAEAYIITLTHDNQKMVETRARSLRVNYHIVTPYSIDEITSILTYLATRKEQHHGEVV